MKSSASRTPQLSENQERENVTAAMLAADVPRHIVLRRADAAAADAGDRPGAAEVALPLVDELDLQRCLVHPSRTAARRASSIRGVLIGRERLDALCRAEGRRGADGEGAGDVAACPCCRRFVPLDERGDIAGGDCREALRRGHDRGQPCGAGEALASSSPEAPPASPRLTLAARVGAAVTNLAAAPPLVPGDRVGDVVVTATLVQGWLYKKGTGDDWAGRRWWKPRWVTLALAENATTVVPTPILISHRAPGVPYPASVVELTESTVIMAVERTTRGGESGGAGGPRRPDEDAAAWEEWNRHCFQVVPVGRACPGAAARTFTAPAAERNEWVHANAALLEHERRRGRARGAAAGREGRARGGVVEKRARRREGVGLARHCGDAAAEEQAGWPWTSGGRGGGRMPSPSPVRAGAALGLPPTSPRRTRSPGRASTDSLEALFHNITP